jgi:hypothetical protein
MVSEAAIYGKASYLLRWRIFAEQKTQKNLRPTTIERRFENTFG